MHAAISLLLIPGLFTDRKDVNTYIIRTHTYTYIYAYVRVIETCTIFNVIDNSRKPGINRYLCGSTM